MIGKKSMSDLVFDIVNYIVVTAVFVLMLYPFLYVINYSISTSHKITQPLMLWPQGLQFESYKALLANPNVLSAVGVSIARTVVGSVLSLFVSGMAAYGLSRRDLIWGKAVRLFFILPMYFGAGIIPTYIVIYNLGLTNTFWVYVLPSAASSFFMLLMRNYIESIPSSMEEAVLVDGGNEIDAYFRVLLPICLPINAAVLIFGAIGQWNTFMDTQLYNMTNHSMHTLQYVLYSMISQRLYISLEQMRTDAKNIQLNEKNLQMAMAVVTVVPIMLVYPLMQRYFVSGIMIGSVKE